MAQQKKSKAIASPRYPGYQDSSAHESEQREKFIERIHQWWINLANPTKLRKSPDEIVAQITRKTRDQTVVGILVILASLFMKYPILFKVLGVVIGLCAILDSMSIRSAIERGEKITEAEEKSSKGCARILSETIILGILLTVFAIWISSGPEWAEKFPLLKEFADWQILKVNELMQFFLDLVHGKL